MLAVGVHHIEKLYKLIVPTKVLPGWNHYVPRAIKHHSGKNRGSAGEKQKKQENNQVTMNNIHLFATS